MFNSFGGLPDLREFPGYRGLSGFKQFLLRGNVVDLAVAVVIGTAFTAVVTSFAESFLEPLIALAGGGGRLGGTLSVGGQTFTWGAFLSQVITFVLTAAVVYFVVVLPLHKLLQRRASEPAAPAGPTELELLVEIRDLLRASQGVASPGASGRPDRTGPSDG
ncbi:MAG: large conductance mechanosensitive channel protein MscL [Actinomycetes bacterium]